MRNRDVQRAESGMWTGLIAMILGGALMFLSPVAGALTEAPIAAVAAMLLGLVLLALGGLSLLFKVVADRIDEQRHDKYSKDIDT